MRPGASPNSTSTVKAPHACLHYEALHNALRARLSRRRGCRGSLPRLGRGGRGRGRGRSSGGAWGGCGGSHISCTVATARGPGLGGAQGFGTGPSPRCLRWHGLGGAPTNASASASGGGGGLPAGTAQGSHTALCLQEVVLTGLKHVAGGLVVVHKPWAGHVAGGGQDLSSRPFFPFGEQGRTHAPPPPTPPAACMNDSTVVSPTNLRPRARRALVALQTVTVGCTPAAQARK
jgi:hypothetical protein